MCVAEQVVGEMPSGRPHPGRVEPFPQVHDRVGRVEMLGLPGLPVQEDKGPDHEDPRAEEGPDGYAEPIDHTLPFRSGEGALTTEMAP